MDEKTEVTFLAPDGLKLQVTNQSFIVLSSPKPPPDILCLFGPFPLCRGPQVQVGPGREGLREAAETGSEHLRPFQYVLHGVSCGGPVLSKQA